MGLKFGYLQGTFGLPYGGYCLRPQALDDIVLNADSDHRSMFCLTGRLSEVMAWLEQRDCMVVSQCTRQDTYMHDIAVDLYSKSSSLARIFKGKANMDVQLVMRILRTWDKQGVKQKEFKPVLKVIVPSGVTLPEIREELGRATPNVLLDATSNKELLDTVLSRVTSRNSALTRSQSVGSNSSSGSSGSQLPPPYESSSNAPPPAYTG